jgi:DNA-binding NarL/FixJ family response regulator
VLPVDGGPHRQHELTDAPSVAVQRVLVVHGQVSFGDAVALRLRREPDLDVPDAVARPAGALALVTARSIDTVVLDWDLPAGAADLARLLGELDRPPSLVVLGSTTDPTTVVDALRAGARAWLPKTTSVDLLLDALRSTRRGEAWLPGDVLGPVLDHLLVAQAGPPPGPLDVLTDRELEVLRCMVAGLDQSAIAAQLFLSPNTVRTHRRRTLAKLGVHTSLEAVFVARRAGLTPVHAR